MYRVRINSHNKMNCIAYFHTLSREDQNALTLDSYLKSCRSPTPSIVMRLLLDKDKSELEQRNWWEWLAHFDALDNQEPYEMLPTDYVCDEFVYRGDDGDQIEEEWSSSSEEEFVEELEDGLGDSWELL
jgi:hypothetical protein